MNKGLKRECSFYTDFQKTILTFFSTNGNAVHDLKAFFKDHK